MTVADLIKREQKKHAPKKIGDDIALNIHDALTYEELYFEDCENVDSNNYDFEDLEDLEVVNHEYVEDYGDLKGKLKLNIEVE